MHIIEFWTVHRKLGRYYTANSFLFLKYPVRMYTWTTAITIRTKILRKALHWILLSNDSIASVQEKCLRCCIEWVVITFSMDIFSCVLIMLVSENLLKRFICLSDFDTYLVHIVYWLTWANWMSKARVTCDRVLFRFVSNGKVKGQSFWIAV